MSTTKIMDKDTLRRTLMRLAHEILEKNKGVKDLCLVGIRTGGAILAERLQACIKEIENVEVPLGLLDITLYRDDIVSAGAQPILRETHIDFDLTGKQVILVDDVLFTGRTIRAALDALIDFGRPANIQLAVLVDRGHRELPIRADYVGKNIPTAIDDDVCVNLAEMGNKEDEVVIKKRGEK